MSVEFDPEPARISSEAEELKTYREFTPLVMMFLDALCEAAHRYLKSPTARNKAELEEAVKATRQARGSEPLDPV